jgi:acetylornithine aminotransferase
MNLFDVYPLLDVEPVRAEGCRLWDAAGESYLDFYGGHAVISIGHTHPRYVERITAQLAAMGFYSNSVRIRVQQELASALGALSGYPDYRLFVCNSGAEANENALKLASFHTGRQGVVAFTKAFHGRTSLAVAATDDASILAPVNATPHVRFLPFNDIDALAGGITRDIAAVIVEGIQGVGGVRVATDEFLQALREHCDRAGAVLVLDEVQSGYGRTGRVFAHQQSGIRPDLITVAKGMGNGFPIGGVLISPAFQSRFGLLGTTFGGNHLACAAALAVLEVIESEHLMENAVAVGAQLGAALEGAPGIAEVRGRGLMLGIELNRPAAPVRAALLSSHRIFTGSSSDARTIRLLPPLCAGKAEAELVIHALHTELAKEAMS